LAPVDTIPPERLGSPPVAPEPEVRVRARRARGRRKRSSISPCQCPTGSAPQKLRWSSPVRPERPPRDRGRWRSALRAATSPRGDHRGRGPQAARRRSPLAAAWLVSATVPRLVSATRLPWQ